MAKKFNGAFYLSFLDRSMSLVVGNELEAFPPYFRKPCRLRRIFRRSFSSLFVRQASLVRSLQVGLVPIFAAGSFEEWFLGRLGLSPVHRGQVRHQSDRFMGGGTAKRQTRRCEIPAGHEKAGSKGGYGIVPADVRSPRCLPSQKGSEFGQDPGFLPALRSIGRSFGEGFPQSPRYGGGGRSFGKRGSPQAIGG